MGCSSREPEQQPVIYSKNNPEVNSTKPKSPSITARTLVAELGSNFVREIHFKKSSTRLSKKDQKKLKELNREATKEKKDIKSVKIISWGDKEYPEKSKTESDKQEKLARERGQKVKKYLEKFGKGVTIDIINMAEKKSNLTPIIDSEEARIKESLTIQDFHKEKASLVIVIYLLED